MALKADIVEEYETLYPHLMDKVNIPELKLAVGRYEKETDRRQEYVSDLKKVFSRLLKVNSKEQYSQTEKSLWNDTTQYEAHNYMRDGRSRSEEGEKDYYEDSDDYEIKEKRRKAKEDIAINAKT